MTEPSAVRGRDDALRNLTDIGSALALAAVEAWRLSRVIPRLCDADGARVSTIAERLSAVLSQSGITVEEHTGQDYLDGMRVTVVATETNEAIPPGSVRILETVKPSVYVRGELAVPGQVVLGRGVSEAAS